MEQGIWPDSLIKTQHKQKQGMCSFFKNSFIPIFKPESELTLFRSPWSVFAHQPGRPLVGLFGCFPWLLALLMERWLSLRSNQGFRISKQGCKGCLWIGDRSSITLFMWPKALWLPFLDFIQVHYVTTCLWNQCQFVTQCSCVCPCVVGVSAPQEHSVPDICNCNRLIVSTVVVLNSLPILGS